MEEMSLLTVCLTALVAVFAVLIALSLVIRLLEVIFPSRVESDDEALFAAISVVATSLYPGARVTRIEEQP
jgi:hypothetical protein